jgi:hypothetical protein
MVRLIAGIGGPAMIRHKFIYPRGSGGAWLSNLIWHLETRNFSIPSVERVFDGLPASSIPFKHSFEIMNPHNPLDVCYPNTNDNLSNFLFSTNSLFVLYLNDAFKVRYGIHKLAERSSKDQLFDLTDSATYIFTNQHYQEHYCENIDLEYRLVFQDQVRFIQQLFEILDQIGIDYEKNQDYCINSINYYKTTVANPMQQIGNLDSLMWLGACHAMLSIDNISVPFIHDDAVLADFKEIFAPWNAYCIQKISPMSFEWL